MSTISLANNSIILLRDQASLDYLQAGQDAEPSNAFARLMQGNLTSLQPSLYFQVKATGAAGYWALKTASGKYLKVNVHPGPKQDQIQWVSTDPASETVVDKSPYYFAFLPVPLADSPSLYVLSSYYNGGMTLQQPAGPGTDLILSTAQLVPGTAPELSFEIGSTSGITASLASLNPQLNLAPVGAAAAAAAAATGDSDSNSTSGTITPVTTQTVDPWAIALLIVLGVIAALLLGYVVYTSWVRTPASAGDPPLLIGGGGAGRHEDVLLSSVRAAGAALASAAADAATTTTTVAADGPFRVPTNSLFPNKMAGTNLMPPVKRLAKLNATRAPSCHSGHGSFGLHL